MEPSSARGMRVRFAAAIRLATVVASAALLMTCGRGEQQTDGPAHESFVDYFERVRSAAAENDRDLLLWFHRHQTMNLRGDPDVEFEREVLQDARRERALAERFEILDIVRDDAMRRAELPPTLQWWAKVVGGPELLSGVDGGATEHAEGLQWMPSLIVCGRDGQVFGSPRAYEPGEADAFVDELCELADRCREFGLGLAAARAREGVERARGIAALFDLVETNVLLSRKALLEEVSSLDPAPGGDAGRRARELLHRRDEVVAMREVFEVATPLVPKVSPRRIRRSLQPLRDRYPALPAAQQAADWCEAYVDYRLTIHDDQRDELLAKLRAAIARDEDSPMAPELRAFVARVAAERGR